MADVFDWKSFENKFLEEFKNISSKLEANFKKLYVSRVHPDLVGNIHVEAYGSEMKLSELSNISVPAARQLMIKPYDPNTIEDIHKALQKQKPEFSPIVQSDHIKIILNPPTEESRKKAVKEAKEYLEQGKVAVRILRKDFLSELKSENLSEDQEKKASSDIDSLVKNMNNKLDELFSNKEKELMTL